LKSAPTACLFLFFPLLALAHPSHEFRGIRALDLKIAAGNVKVSGIEGEISTVGVLKKRYDERCQLVVEQRNDTLFVELAPKGLYQARCEADFEFHLPKTVSLKVKNADGDVRVEGMTDTHIFQQRRPQSRK
jgi:hypothetical protein